MFFDDAAAIDEAALNRLVQGRIEEMVDLEFKQQLDLDTKERKREAGKDISAMANTAGGQILYGIAEAEVNGVKVASAITPLTDESMVERLADVLANSLHPRVFPIMRKVRLAAGGFVLVVQVPNSHNDLHMVSGYETFRFYKRDTKGTVPMTEPEVRQSYERITLNKAELEKRLGPLIADQLRVRVIAEESIIIAAWQAGPNHFDPQALSPLGSTLVGRVLRDLPDTQYYGDFRIDAGGYRMTLPHKASVEDAGVYWAVNRNGVLHFSYNGAFDSVSEKNDRFRFGSGPALYRIFISLLIAQHACRVVKHWAPVRLVYALRPRGPFWIDPGQFTTSAPISPTELLTTPIDVGLEESRAVGRACKQVLDQVFQMRGDANCPQFEESGEMKDEYKKKQFPKRMVELLS